MSNNVLKRKKLDWESLTEEAKKFIAEKEKEDSEEPQLPTAEELLAAKIRPNESPQYWSNVRAKKTLDKIDAWIKDTKLRTNINKLKKKKANYV